MYKYKHIPKKILSKTESLMLHAIGFVSGDPSVRINYPYLYHPGLNVTVTKASDAKWIYMMLPVTQGSLITDINIAHRRSAVFSHISMIRLVEQREPTSATVLFDKYIDHTVPTTSIVGASCRVVVKNSIMLKVCMDFVDTNDEIELGSVEVRYIPDYMTLPPHLRKEIEEVHHEKEWLADLLNTKTSMNSERPSLMDLILQKKGKRKISF